MFQKFAIGEELNGFKNSQEGISMDIDGNGLSFYITFNNPTAEEINGVNKGRIKLSFLKIDDTPVFVLNTEGNSMDCCPLRSNGIKLEEITSPDLGYAVHIVLIDAISGKIRGMRYFGASNGFSKRFRKEWNNLEIDPEKIREKVFKIQARYSTKELEKMSTINCSI